jgi:hypothetical protein
MDEARDITLLTRDPEDLGGGELRRLRIRPLPIAETLRGRDAQ